jgi:predicted ABC-type ATPase
VTRFIDPDHGDGISIAWPPPPMTASQRRAWRPGRTRWNARTDTGKSTFYHAHLSSAGLRFVNADDLARELEIGAEEAARLARELRKTLLAARESFVFETVFSDPVGDELAFLHEAAAAGFAVVLCFIGLPSAQTSEERVSMRVAQGGHDVPTEKLSARFARVLANLGRAIRELPTVLVFDNGDLSHPYRKVAELRGGAVVELKKPVPEWLARLLP